MNKSVAAKKADFCNIKDRFNNSDNSNSPPLPIRLILTQGEGCAPTLVHPADRTWKGFLAEELSPTVIVDQSPVNAPWYQFFLSKPAELIAEQQIAFKRWRSIAEAAGSELRNLFETPDDTVTAPRNPIIFWAYSLVLASRTFTQISVTTHSENEHIIEDVILASSTFANRLATESWPLQEEEHRSAEAELTAIAQQLFELMRSTSGQNKKKAKKSSEEDKYWEEIHRDYKKFKKTHENHNRENVVGTRKFEQFYASTPGLKATDKEEVWKKLCSAGRRIRRRKS